MASNSRSAEGHPPSSQQYAGYRKAYPPFPETYSYGPTGYHHYPHHAGVARSTYSALNPAHYTPNQGAHYGRWFQGSAHPMNGQYPKYPKTFDSHHATRDEFNLPHHQDRKRKEERAKMIIPNSPTRPYVEERTPSTVFDSFHRRKRLRTCSEDEIREKEVSSNLSPRNEIEMGQRQKQLLAEKNVMPQNTRYEEEAQSPENRVGSEELASAITLASLAKQGQAQTNENAQMMPPPSSRTVPLTPSKKTIEKTAFNKNNTAVIVTPSIKSPSTYRPSVKSTQVPNTMKPSAVSEDHQVVCQHPPAHLRVPLMGEQLHSNHENKWICDFCNVASFETFEEACEHEKICKLQSPVDPLSPKRSECSNGAFSNNGDQIGDTNIKDQVSNHEGSVKNCSDSDDNTLGSMVKEEREKGTDNYYSGTLPLAIPSTDTEWLSELNCFIRRECVETFSASEEDAIRTSKRGRICPKQVGIRCVFCTAKPPQERAVAAVSFPVSISGIYESVKRWQRVHLESCSEIPSEVRERIKHLSKSSVWVPTTRQYWADSAKAIGIIDTPEGLRFNKNPSRPSNLSASFVMESSRFPVKSREKGSRINKNPANPSVHKGSSQYIVFPEDQQFIPPYVYYLMRQVQVCKFTEADRFVARSKGTLGFSGFECRHCSGHAGLGKYFPTSSKGLSTNSTSQNLYSHLMKCRRCPQEVRDRLNLLKPEKEHLRRLPSGWRKAFFDRVWKRLHDDEAV